MPNLNSLRASVLLHAPVFYSSGTRCAKLTDIVINRSKRAPLLRGIVIDCGFKNSLFVPYSFIQSMDQEQIIIDIEQHNLFDEFAQRADEILLFANILNCKKSAFKSLSGKIIDARIVTSESGERFVDGVYVRTQKPREKKIAHYLKLPKLAQKRTEKFIPWRNLFLFMEEGSEVVQFLQTHAQDRAPDLADALLDLPSPTMLEVVTELSDDRLADVLEEMPERNQKDIIEHLQEGRAADILEKMQPDDAADLVAQLDSEKSNSLLELMDTDEALEVRRLLEFEPNTAGGLMTTRAIVLGEDATVAQALVLIRKQEIAPVLATAVFVTKPPHTCPGGTYLGLVHFQKLLRYPPSELLKNILDTETKPAAQDAEDVEVVRSLARYNLVALPVIDEEGMLAGIVTVDDVLDHILPSNWRSAR